MRRYGNEPVKETAPPAHSPAPVMAEPVKEDPPSKMYYVVSWVIFMAAVLVNVGVWAVDYFATHVQHSYYYEERFTVSANVDNNSYTDSTQMFTESTSSVKAVAMALIFSWLLWKTAVMVYAYHVISNSESKGLRIGTFIALVLVLLAIDILLTSFAKLYWRDYGFMGVAIIFISIVALVNAKEKCRSLGNVLIPLLWYSMLYFLCGWVFPRLYNVYINNMAQLSAYFLIFYTYPAWDLILYSLTLFLGTKVDDDVKPFFSTIHYFLLGYAVGITMLIGYTEVEFYYLLAYFIFRNIFVNHVMRRWEKVVANPPCLPGWIACYYFSYGFSYLPVIGVGGVVVAKSFLSFMWAKTSTLLYGLTNPDYYPFESASRAPTGNLSTNPGLKGNIIWIAALLLWVGTTFTQTYSCRKPRLYDLFYYLFGIHLFYMGVTCGLSLAELIDNNF